MSLSISKGLRLGLGLAAVLGSSFLFLLASGLDGVEDNGYVSVRFAPTEVSAPVPNSRPGKCLRGDVLVGRILENPASVRWSGPDYLSLWRLVKGRWSIHVDPYVNQTWGGKRPVVVVVGLERRMTRDRRVHGGGKKRHDRRSRPGGGNDGGHRNADSSRWNLGRLVSNRRAMLFSGGSSMEYPLVFSSGTETIRFEADLALLRMPKQGRAWGTGGDLPARPGGRGMHLVGGTNTGLRTRPGRDRPISATGERAAGREHRRRVVSASALVVRIGVREEGGRRRWLVTRKFRRADEEQWRHLELRIPATEKKSWLLVQVQGPSRRVLALGNPELWEEGRCRPGPNLLLVILDAVRADAVDWTGRRGNWTPNLASLARRGVVFDKAFSGASRTRASMTSMLTSRWPAGLGLSVGHDRLTHRARAAVLATLRKHLFTRALQRAGYRTAAMGNNFYFLGHTIIGLDRALDSALEVEGVNRDAEVIAENVVRFLERNKKRSFFLWVHFEGGHAPYRPPRGWEVSGRAVGAPSDRAFEQYLGAVHWTDSQLGKILTALKRTGLGGNTFVVVTADHGEVFSRAHSFVVNGTHTRHRHGWSAYNEVFHVPLVISGPNVAKGRRVAQRICHLDLVPTLAQLMGRPPEAPVDGWDLGPLLKPGRDGSLVRDLQRRLDGRPVLSQAKGQWSVLEGRWHFIRRWGQAQDVWIDDRFEHRTNELYDLANDPGETRNLAVMRPKIVRRLFRLARDRFGRPALRRTGSNHRWGPRLCFVLKPGAKKKQCRAQIRLRGEEMELSQAVGGVFVRWGNAVLGRGGMHVSDAGGAGGMGSKRDGGGRRTPFDLWISLRAKGDGDARVCLTMPVGPVAVSDLVLDGDGGSGLACGAYGLHCKAGDLQSDLRYLPLIAGRPAGTDESGHGTLWIWREGTGSGLQAGRETSGGTVNGDKQVDGLLRSWGYSSRSSRKAGQAVSRHASPR